MDLPSSSPPVPERRIAHLDMDAFYASVELLRYPELRGLPVVIGGGQRHQPVLRADGTREFARLRDYAGRGVITTSTYEARALGVFSAMGTMKAAQLAPDAVLLPIDFEEYRKLLAGFQGGGARLGTLCRGPRHRRDLHRPHATCPACSDDGGRAAAQALKDAVSDATGLTCSIGVTPNKLLSKLASELDKPDGLTVLEASDIPTRIWPLAARKLNGIGPKASEKLAALGLHTIGDIAAADPPWLVERFGRSYGTWLHEASHGRDERPVVTYSEPKSISRETTFERDLHAVRDRAALSAIFTRLCVQLAGDLARKGYASRTIGIKLRFDDFKSVTRDLSLPAHTLDARAIRRAAGQCLKRIDLTRRLRLLGVRAGALAKVNDLVAAHPAVTSSPAMAACEPGSLAALPLFAQAFDAEGHEAAAAR